MIESVQEEKMEQGKDKRVDCEHIRHGVVSVFIANEPLTRQRLAEITGFKKKKDRANFVKRIADEMYPDAGEITLVPDYFKTHSTGSFYEAFKPVEAKGLIDRFESVFTPKHGNRLNMAEIELHALNTQCLNRLVTIEKMKQEIEAWQEHRNNKKCKINWQFTTDDARVKLKQLYPAF